MLHIAGAIALVICAFVAAWYLAPKGWRTLAFNLLAAIPLVGAPLTDALMGFDWSLFFDKASAATMTLAVTIGNVLLRAVTSTPLGSKGDDDE